MGCSGTHSPCNVMNESNCNVCDCLWLMGTCRGTNPQCPGISESYCTNCGCEWRALEDGLQINVGDSWRDCIEMKMNVGDSWKTVVAIYINIGDSWKTVYEA